MQKFKGVFLFVLFICLTWSKSAISQSQVAISLNEYQVTNTNIVPLDNYNQPSDWVELYNAHTSSVNLSGYYLSNDKTNLYKWRFPNTFTMAVNSYSVVWLSGRNEAKLVGGQYIHHANFTIDQCKNQWLILTTPQGVIRDSIFVQRTQENHTRGRVDYTNIGVQAWRLFTGPSFLAQNPNTYYKDYCPIPKFTEKPGFGVIATPTFEIYHVQPGIGIDTSCYQVWYTMDGSNPTPSVGTSQQFIDGVGTPIMPPTQTTVFRAVTYPVTATGTNPATYCQLNYLPSFCETNTYFADPQNQENNFNKKFGILSIAVHTTNTTWTLTGVGQPTVHAEYFELSASDQKRFVLEGIAQINKPVNDAWLTFQKGFNLSIDDRRGFGCNFESNIFNVSELGTSSRTVFPTLEVYSGDIESHSAPMTNTTLPSNGTGVRDIFLQSLAIKNNINVNPLHIKPIAVFMNGNYYGTFNFKETYDQYYEEYYNKQPKETSSLLFYHNNEGSVQSFTTTNDWKTNIYDFIINYPMQNVTNYTNLKNRMDIPNFIDWNIMNSFTQNSNLYNYNIAFAKGSNTLTTGGKWHHYLWNMPATFQFTAVATNTLFYNYPTSTPCAIQQPSTAYAVSPNRYNGQGAMFNKLMNANVGSGEFRQDYLTRYQDLLNGPFKCENLLKHWETINNLYRDEMKKHEDPGTAPFPGQFVTQTDLWDTNMAILKRALDKRCQYMSTAMSGSVSCYGLVGPYELLVDVEPVGAGTVKLNTWTLPYYMWGGRYFKGPMSFKAYPADTTYVFDHWELKNHTPLNSRPLSLDSISIDFSNTNGDYVVAVFTDKKNDAVLPTGFSPNGDGNNDVFGIMGAGKYSREFEMRIWNRWGQEIFRSTDPLTGWDGNYNGSQAQTGVYAYYITYKNIYNETKILKGNVTLVR